MRCSEPAPRAPVTTQASRGPGHRVCVIRIQMLARRIVLYLAATMVVIAVIVITYVFGRSFMPTDAAVRSHILEIDLDEIPPGATRTFVVPGSRIEIMIIHHSTGQDIENLARVNQYLRDPDSLKSRQPSYTRNRFRSIKPE